MEQIDVMMYGPIQLCFILFYVMLYVLCCSVLLGCVFSVRLPIEFGSSFVCFSLIYLRVRCSVSASASYGCISMFIFVLFLV